MKTDHLYTLVQTLTAREKANFIRFARSNKSNSNTIKLFRLLCSMEEYDEAGLRKKLGESAVRGNFAVTKSYLYELILKALRNYSLEHSVHQQVYQGLAHIQLLMERLLFEDAERQLVKVKRLAEKYELLEFQNEILNIEYQIAIFTRKPAEMHTALNGIKAEQHIVREKLQYFQRCNDLLNQIYLVRIRYSAKLGTEELEHALRALDIALLDDDPPYNSFRLNTIRDYCFMVLNELRMKGDLAMAHEEKLLEAYKQSPHQIEIEHRPYSMLVFSYCYFALEKGREDIVLEYMEILKNLSEGSGPDFPRRRVRKIYYNLMLRYIYLYRQSLIPKALEKEISGCINNKSLSQDNPKPDAQILAMLVKMKIIRGDFDKSLEYANVVINTIADRIPKRVLTDVYLMHVLAHYELGNYEYIASFIRSLGRRLAKEDIPAHMEPVLQAIRHLLNCGDSESKRQVFLRLREDLYNISGGVPGVWGRGLLFYVWAEHKLSGIAMDEVHDLLYRKDSSCVSPVQKKNRGLEKNNANSTENIRDEEYITTRTGNKQNAPAAG